MKRLFLYLGITSLYSFCLPLACSRGDQAEQILAGIQSKRESIRSASFTVEDTKVRGNSAGGQDTFHSQWNVTMNAKEVLFRRVDAFASAILRQNEVVSALDNSVNIYGIASGSTAYVYNPRLLGICRGPHENSSFSFALRVGERQTLELERTNLNGMLVQKVTIVDKEGVRFSFWVETEKGFRVHKFESVTPNVWREEISSEYSDSFAKGLLPTKLVTDGENLIAGTKFIYTRVLSDYNEGAPSKLDLKDMGLTVGMPISDIRIHQRIGYWNGTKLVDSPPNTHTELRMSAEAVKKRSSPNYYWILAGLVIGIFFLVGIRMKMKSND